MRIRVHLALVDQTLLVVVKELDRVLDRDHVLFTLVVNLVEHGSQRRGLTRAGRPGHQYEPARLVAQPADHCRKAEVIEALDFPRNGPENCRYRAALVKDIAAETRQALQPER